MDWNHDGKIDAKDSTLYHCCIKDNDSQPTSEKPPSIGKKSTYTPTNNTSSEANWGRFILFFLVYLLVKLIIG